MITLCTVVLDGIECFADILIESIIKRTKHISEVLVCKIDSEGDWPEQKVRGMTLRKFSHPLKDKSYGHALGLHACIKRASNDYVMLCEPDLFFYTAVDELYLDLFAKHDLNIVGITHHNAIGECSMFFPYPMNLMVKKSTLPDENWGKGLIKIGRGIHKMTDPQNEDKSTLTDADGMFLVQGPVPEWQDSFPNKSAIAWFDIGCNLWVWNEERKGKWVSFQTLDTHLYTTRFYRSNFKLKEKFPLQNLVYHQTNCTNNKKEAYKLFKEAYERG